MSITRRDLSALLAAAAVPVTARADTVREPLVIARGGAAGDAPEATREAYDQAIRDGADFLAASIYLSQDAVPVALPRAELSAFTDVAARPEFAARRATKTSDGDAAGGWYVEDFTVAELKTLVCGAGPARRGKGEAPPRILSFQELIDVARAGCVRTARVIGVYAILPNPRDSATVQDGRTQAVVEAIRKNGYDAQAAAMIVASPEPAILKALARGTRVRRVLRLRPDAPFDAAAIRAVAHAVAPDLSRVVDAANPKRPAATPLIGQAHAAGLGVHAWAAAGDPQGLMEAAYAAGADAVSSDLARPAARARAHTMSENRET